MKLITQLIKSFEMFKDLIAISYQNRKLTYKQLFNLSLGVSGQIQNLSLYNKPIGIICERGFEQYISILGILFSGNHYVPINLNDNFEKNKNIILSSNLNIICGSLKSINKFKDKINSSDIKVSFLEVKSENNNANKNNIQFTNDDSLLYILYTSGSTGLPKGVKINKLNIYSFVQSIKKIWKLKTKYKFSQFFELSFDPSMADIFVCFLSGGELCVVPKNELFYPIDFINREKIDIWASVPSVGLILQKSEKLEKDIFPNLKILCFCGEPFPQNIANIISKSAPSAEIWNCYGPTEATIYVSGFRYTPGDYEYCNNNLPIGESFNQMNIEIVDQNNLKVKPGLKGEIVYKGPQISPGYLNDHKKNFESFVKFDWDDSNEIWYKSGDLGLVNEYGQIECLGRIDNQIKISGKRVEISEIEFFFKSKTIFDDMVIIPIKNNNLMVTNLIGFTTRFFQQSDIEEIRTFSFKYINKAFFPNKIIRIKKFHYNLNGKLDRNFLIENYD